MTLLSHTSASRCAAFGRFSYLKGPGDAIVPDPAWVRANIVEIYSPQLKRDARLHRLAVEPFHLLMREWELRDLLKEIHTWNGSYVPRFKRGRRGGIAALSNHAWGTAFDVNARLYPLGMPVPEDSRQRELARIANFCGWFWGGDFRSRPDGMHFEIGREV